MPAETMAFKIESYGAPAFTKQPFHALYKAPYTTRAADLRPTKVDDIRLTFNPEFALAYDGVFALPLDNRGDVYVEIYRASDGRHIREDFGPGLLFSYPIYTSEMEFMSLAGDSSIARVKLGPWP